MDGLLANLGPILLMPLEKLWQGLNGLDLQWKLALIGVALLLLLGLCLKARFVGGAGGRALRRQYKKLIKQGVAEWELPYRLLCSREEWDLLPDEFLMELASRLEERDRVIDFILTVEDDDFDRESLIRLTYYEPEMAMKELSLLLTELASDNPARKAIGLLDQALQIDPENSLAVIDLATQHYAEKRYALALPLLEQAMTLSQTSLPQMRAAAGRKSGEAATAHNLHGLLKLLGEMYEDCQQQVGAKA